MVFKNYKEFRKVREKVEAESQKKNRRKNMLFNLFLLVFFSVLLPCLVVAIFNFFNLVVFGSLTVSNFFGSFLEYSWEPVMEFYLKIKKEVQYFIKQRIP